MSRWFAARAELRGIARALVASLFPPACAACGALGREPFCPMCAEDLAPALPFVIEAARDARAVFAHEGSARAAVQRLKYRGAVELGRTLGAVLARALPQLEGPPPQVVVPVPLSLERLRARGYNQARELARALPLPVLARALARKVTHEQVGLGLAARLANARDAIRPGAQSVRGLDVLLVDDVVTTGATATAATRVLLEAGASSVAVLAFTRTSAPSARAS